MDAQIVAGTVIKAPSFFYTDDNNTKYAVMDFAACEGDNGHKFLILFVPVSLYETQKILFTPGKGLYVRGVMDAVKPLIKVQDVWILPARIAANR